MFSELTINDRLEQNKVPIKYPIKRNLVRLTCKIAGSYTRVFTVVPFKLQDLTTHFILTLLENNTVETHIKEPVFIPGGGGYSHCGLTGGSSQFEGLTNWLPNGPFCQPHTTN